MGRLDGDKITKFILAINGSIFLLLGIFGIFYHYLMAATCFLAATLLLISPIRSLTSKSKLFVYLYYSLFLILVLLLILTITGIINTYSE